jgi:hypothetical protein
MNNKILLILILAISADSQTFSANSTIRSTTLATTTKQIPFYKGK